MLDPKKSHERKRRLTDAEQKFNEYSRNLDMKKAYMPLFEILWHSQLPCFDIQNITSKEKDETSILKKCYWKGIHFECSAIFKTHPTDRGMCCTFNREAADSMYHESRYTMALKKMQELDKNLAIEEESVQTSLDMVPIAGEEQGLTLILDAHKDLLTSGTVTDNFNGFVAKITSKNEYPMMRKHSLMIKPGQVNKIAISAVNIKADKKIRTLSTATRQCYFNDEHPLEMHKQYSQQNCIIECALNYSYHQVASRRQGQVKCSPWFYPVADQKLKICNPWEKKDFQKILGKVTYKECNYCLPDCEGIIFESKIDRAALKKCDHTNLGANLFCNLVIDTMNPSIWSQEARDEFKDKSGDVPQYLQKNSANKTIFSNRRYHVPNPEKMKTLALQRKLEQNPTYNAFDEDIAMVNFYFEKQGIQQLERSLKMTLPNYIAQLGGMFGLGLGFSFISFVELIYWMTIRFWENFSSARGKKTIDPNS